MPPCGYREPAVIGIEAFLKDNLAYFISLYRNKGVSISQAIAAELAEIQRVESGDRGGKWSAAIVSINRIFYDRLSSKNCQSWLEVQSLGDEIVAEAVADLRSLTLT